MPKNNFELLQDFVVFVNFCVLYDVRGHAFMKSKLLSNIRENPQNSLNLFKFLVFQRHKYMAPSKYILLTVQNKGSKTIVCI